jgi:hypothetical protein
MKNSTPDYRVVTLSQLKALNDLSMDNGFSYNLCFDTYVEHLKKAMKAKKGLQWRGMDTKVLLVYRMWHDYPNGAAIRCQVFSDGLVPGLLKLDVPEMTYFQLGSSLAA